MTENMIKKLVWAWRTAKGISDGLEETFGIAIDALYDVHGNILDCLREYAFEEGDIEDSEVLRMLQSEDESKYVAISLMTKRALKLSKTITNYDEQPAPKFFTDEQIARMQEVFGGYVNRGT